jgi:hypothetical protein
VIDDTYQVSWKLPAGYFYDFHYSVENPVTLIKSQIRIRARERTFFAPLYSDFWYFSASVIQEVWPFHCEGLANVALQSMHVKEA